MGRELRGLGARLPGLPALIENDPNGLVDSFMEDLTDRLLESR